VQCLREAALGPFVCFFFLNSERHTWERNSLFLTSCFAVACLRYAFMAYSEFLHGWSFSWLVFLRICNLGYMVYNLKA
jgi:hypothetical protein